MPSLIMELLGQLEELFGGRALVYFMKDKAPRTKVIDDEDIPVLYECLRRMPAGGQLNLVLHTIGGRVNVSRRIALLLRSYASEVRMLVPYKARSAGTLLCLSADEIVMGTLSELGPIDPQVVSAGGTPVDAVSQIAAEDVRCFSQMAERWFGVRGAETQLLGMLTQRIFPTSLSTFYRSSQQIRQIAVELLRYQLPEDDAAAIERIVEHLASGYHAHDYAITAAEARALGLQVRVPEQTEEELLWALWRHCDQLLEHDGVSAERKTALIASGGDCAWYLAGADASTSRWAWDADAVGADGTPRGGQRSSVGRSVRSSIA